MFNPLKIKTLGLAPLCLGLAFCGTQPNKPGPSALKMRSQIIAQSEEPTPDTPTLFFLPSQSGRTCVYSMNTHNLFDPVQPLRPNGHNYLEISNALKPFVGMDDFLKIGIAVGIPVTMEKLVSYLEERKILTIPEGDSTSFLGDSAIMTSVIVGLGGAVYLSVKAFPQFRSLYKHFSVSNYAERRSFEEYDHIVHTLSSEPHLIARAYDVSHRVFKRPNPNTPLCAPLAATALMDMMVEKTSSAEPTQDIFN